MIASPLNDDLAIDWIRVNREIGHFSDYFSPGIELLEQKQTLNLRLQSITKELQTYPKTANGITLPGFQDARWHMLKSEYKEVWMQFMVVLKQLRL